MRVPPDAGMFLVSLTSEWMETSSDQPSGQALVGGLHRARQFARIGGLLFLWCNMTQADKKSPPARRKAASAIADDVESSLRSTRTSTRFSTRHPEFSPRRASPSEVSFSTLPPYRMGPYQLQVVAAPREMFTDKRRKVEADWNAGIVHIRQDANESQALTLLTRHLITAIHYRSGLNNSSDEESFAHSCASGFVELALSQRPFFAGYLALVEKIIKPGAGWQQIYLKPRLTPAPKRIVCANRTCTIRFVASDDCTKEQAYGFYFIGQGTIDLSDGLSGPNLALVALHEKLHFLHECAGLDDKATEIMFRDGQTRLLLNSLKDNPGYWRWWLSVLGP